MTWQMTLADALPAQPDQVWTLARQVGVTAAVATIPDTPDGPPPWDYGQLLRMKQQFRDGGLDLQVIESAPHRIMEPIRLGRPNSEERTDRFCELLENMGRVGIPVICPNWMPLIGPLRTSSTIPGRGGALLTSYDHELMRDAPPTDHGPVGEAELWERAEMFLRRVVPVAEEANVRIAIHPDDPPVPSIRGVDRILTNPDAVQRWLDIAPSPSNGVAFCQGTFASMNVDIPATIRRFGRQRQIHFVHFRDIEGTPDNFVETFHDTGPTDMVEAMRAYRDVGYTGPVRVDHVPTLVGETNANPGYEVLGRLFAIGYTRGLMESVDKLG